mgnify:FL=1
MLKDIFKKNKGITLIALVVTIIVLLILAGISISMLTGQNGILNRAAEAKERNESSSALEEIQLVVIGAIGTEGEVDIAKAKEELREKGATITEIGDDLKVEYKNKKYLVTKDGSVSEWTGTETPANAPKLSAGMIPVKYDTSKGKWVVCSKSDSSWYNYSTDQKQWANVMLSDGKYTTATAKIGTQIDEKDLGSMFVWLPRYAYKITSGYHSGAGAIDVQFVGGTSYTYVDKNGEIKTAKNGNEDGVITSSGYTDYVVHPAFTDGSKNTTKYNTETNYQNGEWKKEISGIWVAKFQAGIYTTEDDTNKTVKIKSSQNNQNGSTVYYPVFKGKKYAYNYVSASQCYDISQALDDNGNPYGLNSGSNSHLMKSSEWGAAAYLSISKYGISNGTSAKEKGKNNLSTITWGIASSKPSGIAHPNNSGNWLTAITGYSVSNGKAGENAMSTESYTAETLKTLISKLTDTVSGTNSKPSYAWNKVASNSTEGDGTTSSTTGNIYGIYDMGGCLADYTASYVNASFENLSSFGGSFATGKSTYLATAYPATACITGVYDFNNAYPGFSKIFGDAIYEISGNVGGGQAWFGQTLENDQDNGEVFFPRGGAWFLRCRVSSV